MADVGELDEDETTDDVDETTDTDEDTDNESEDGSGGGGEDPEVKRLRAALAKSRKANAKLRAAAKGGTSNAGTSGSAAAPDVDTVRREAAEEVEAKYTKRIKATSAKAALAGAGLVDSDKPEVLKRAVRLLDLEDLDVDEDGEVEGLDEAIADLKAEFPAMFKKARAKGQVSTGSRTSNGSAAGTGTGRKPQSSAAKLAATLRG